MVTWQTSNLLILRKWWRLANKITIILFKILPTNRFLKKKSYSFHFHENDVTWPLGANGLSMHPARINYLMYAYYPLNKRDISCTWKRNCSLLTASSSILVTFVETLVKLRPVTPSPMLIHAPIFKHNRISTLGKETRSRLGEKLNPQFQSSVSTFDDYCVLF